MKNEIISNDDLVVGDYYHLFTQSHGDHSIGRCCADFNGQQKYIQSNGNSKIWAMDDNNQAMMNWKIFPIEIPQLDTIYLCPKHHGIGFQSDCHLCKEERIMEQL